MEFAESPEPPPPVETSQGLTHPLPRPVHDQLTVVILSDNVKLQTDICETIYVYFCTFLNIVIVCYVFVYLSVLT